MLYQYKKGNEHKTGKKISTYIPTDKQTLK